MAENESENITQPNDLELDKIVIDNIPDDILFPDELITYMRGQIQYLTQANMRLQQTLEEKIQELQKHEFHTSELSNKISEYEMITQDLGVEKVKSSSSTRLMSTKIIELSKKLRQKSSEIENYKNIIAKLQQKILTSSSETSDKDDVPVNKNNTNDTKNVSEDSSEIIKNLQDKINQLNSKLFDSKNQNLKLRNDIKIANKILADELGDNFVSIQNYSNNGQNNWRGRAQQILNLQQKNSELMEKLSVVGSAEKDSNSTKNDILNKKLMIDQLNKELNSIKNELEDKSKKFTASKARIKVLESELCSVKCKLVSQNEKIKNDEQIINLLKSQVCYFEEAQNNFTKENQSILESQMKSLNMELKKEKCKNDNLCLEIKEKDNLIVDLENQIKIYQNEDEKSVYNASNKNLESKIKIYEIETNRLSELVAVLNNRLEEERNQLSELQINFRKERQLAAKLETKVLRLEMENNMYKSQSYSKSSMSRASSSYLNEESPFTVENLKNSLELAQENIKALESRLIILQREKDLDFQRFRAILNDTKNVKNPKENS